MSQIMQGARSPLSAVFLMHIALEIPLAIQGLWSPEFMPFLQLNNTTLVFLKMYAALSFASCIAAFLCFGLPEFLPGKRAFAISLCIYHNIVSTVLIRAPRIIPYSFGQSSEKLGLTPEILWGSLHGLLGFALVVWWQGTLGYVSMVKKAE